MSNQFVLASVHQNTKYIVVINLYTLGDTPVHPGKLVYHYAAPGYNQALW